VARLNVPTGLNQTLKHLMKRLLLPGLVLVPTAALVLPPFLLVPLTYHLPKAQLFKDFYEACLWLSPAVGVAVITAIFRLRRQDIVSFRQPAVLIAVSIAGLDLASPLFFYVLLAILGGH